MVMPHGLPNDLENPSMTAALPTLSTLSTPPKTRFREQMHQAREEAIVLAVHRLLADKGFEAMTVDEVAAAAGMAKPSLYRHFASKEELAAAAMVRVMEQAWQYLQSLDVQAPALQRLREVARWMLQMQLQGDMPTLPSASSSLRSALTGHARYMQLLMAISDQIGAWIVQAQADGGIRPDLPPIVVLYTLYARACDPVVRFLRGTGEFSDDQIIDMVLSTCFDGLAQG